MTPSSPCADIDVQALAFGYGKQPLFARFDAQAGQPGIYGLFGRNGSGKSTLLKLLAGLLTPSAGQVRVRGHVPRRRAAEFLSQIYILPEEFHLPNLRPDTLTRTHAAFYPQFDHALFGDYLAVLDVPPRQRFAQMSLGQKKKAAIAFALATQTPVLLMDEPTNGLDIVSRAQFKTLMARPEQACRTVLISTHQAHDLESVLQHIWFIDNGQLVLGAPMAALSAHLQMGVASDATQLPGAERLLYQEPVGQQSAWVARRASDTEPGLVQLELLYKALSFNKSAVLAALPASMAPTATAPA
ncbi:ABC transporter ATP-binding protein [Ottowia testudinis]|uniref:ABC transporter ATP-binding protein n=2 Tax=Ottowia testudinis TaxID=2816950 RepID=A0A975CKL5_9BURK|nr:ABC transporter ATP-binding protein [Ottowia testudinis]